MTSDQNDQAESRRTMSQDERLQSAPGLSELKTKQTHMRNTQK